MMGGRVLVSPLAVIFLLVDIDVAKKRKMLKAKVLAIIFRNPLSLGTAMSF
jgi:hypothetical protein